MLLKALPAMGWWFILLLAFLASSQVWGKWEREVERGQGRASTSWQGLSVTAWEVGSGEGLAALLPSPLEQPQAREPSWKSTTRRGHG